MHMSRAHRAADFAFGCFTRAVRHALMLRFVLIQQLSASPGQAFHILYSS